MAVNAKHILVVPEIEPAQFQMQFYSEDVVRIFCKERISRKKNAGSDADV